VVEELYGTRYQSGSFSLLNVGSGFHCLRSSSFFLSLTPCQVTRQGWCFFLASLSQMSSVRHYVSRQLAHDMSESARDQDAVAKLSSETAGLRAELHKLKSEVRFSVCVRYVFV